MIKILSFAFILSTVTFSAYPQLPECSHAKSYNHNINDVNQVADSRLDLYDVRHVFLDLHADNLSTYISGDATLLLQANAVISTLVLELSNQIDVASVQINDESATYIHTGDLLEVAISNEIAGGEIFTCKVTYEGEPNPGSGIFSGINNATSQTWENQVTWTLSEPFNAKLWWPCKQVLTDKIDSVWVFVTTDENLKVGSNGILTSTVSLPGNKVRYEWKSNYPIAYYLISMTIAEYVEYSNYAKPAALNGNDSILIQNYIYDNPETLPYFKDELDEIPNMIELFSDYYVLYPFYEEKYGHAMAPFGGGMEHQTMSSMGLFSFTLDAHELGHQWFGDLVTCETWQDIWINEGFARFSEYLALEKLLSPYAAEQYRLSDMDVVLGAMNGSVYVPEESANDENRIFNYVLTYLKGGLIIQMMREVVNDDEVFFEVLETFLEQHRHGTATGEDFKHVLESVSGSQFDEFFDQWYYGEGYPIFYITWRTSMDSLFITSQQTTTSTTELFSTPLEFAVSYESGETDTFRISQSQNLETFSRHINGPIKKLTFDPNNWLINGLDRFVRVDEQGNAVSTDPIAKNLTIYPNPANKEIFFSRRLSEIRIYDTTGRNVYSYEGASILKMDISSLAPGFYILEAKADGQQVKRRIIVE